MKILEVAEFYSEHGGGFRTYVRHKFEAAAAAGHTLSILAPGLEDRMETRAGGKLIWVKSPAIPFDKRYHLFWDQRAIDEIVAAERPDFIEGSSPWRGAWFAGRQPQAIPKALVIHQDPVLSYPHTVLRNLLSERRIDKLFGWFFCYFRNLQSLYDTSVVSSAWLADRLSGAGMRRPQIIPFGVNRESFLCAQRSETLRREMLAKCGVDHPDAKLLVTISRHHPEKRIPLMIEAFQAAAASGPMGLFVIGDGPVRAKIDKLAAKTPGVHIAGFINDRDAIADMLASADAYIHGCPNETYGMVIAEALCAGLPQIVPDKGGAAELPSPDCAEFYEADNAEACACAIVRLFQRDPELLRAGVRQSSAHVYDMTDHFRALFATYERLVDRGAESRRIEKTPIGNEFPLPHRAP